MKQRNVGLDVLRILLALMVIAIHFNAPATGHVAKSVTGNMKYLVYPMVSFCYPAVNTYVLISGYFGYKYKKNLKSILNSLIKLWLCLLFFSLLGYFIAILMGQNCFCISDFIWHFFPLSRGVWWYMTVYFVLMLISPVLNFLLDNSTKKEYVLSMTGALVICTIIPFFINYESRLGLNQGYGLIWFVVLYLSGGGMFKFFLQERNKKKIVSSGLWYMVFTIVPIVVSYVVKVIGIKELPTFLMYNSISVYGQSIFLFMLFFNIDIKKAIATKIVTSLATLSLAAYIFHCQEDICKMIWKFTEPYKYADSLYLIPLFLYTVFGLYFLGIIIEFIRKSLFSIGDFEKKITSGILHGVLMVSDRIFIIYGKYIK